MAEPVRLLVPVALAGLDGDSGLALADALAEALALADDNTPSLPDDEGLGVPVRDDDDVPVGVGVLEQVPLHDCVTGSCEPEADADTEPLALPLTDALEP